MEDSCGYFTALVHATPYPPMCGRLRRSTETTTFSRRSQLDDVQGQNADSQTQCCFFLARITGMVRSGAP